METLHNGVVKWFSDKRGYGFIVDTDTGIEYFVHYSAIESEHKFKKLAEGQRVTFCLDISNSKGPVAVNVNSVKEETNEH